MRIEKPTDDTILVTDGAASPVLDPRPRRVWCNDVLVQNWSSADEFRRVVITDGGARFGAVHIERLPDDDAETQPQDGPPQAPVDAGFSGVLVGVADAPPPAPAAPPPAAPKKKTSRRRR
jgi:hypothetical protein